MQKNKKIIQFAQSFMLLPMLTMSMPVVPASQVVSANMQYLGSTEELALNQAMDEKAKVLQAEAEAIDGYFQAHKMPLFGTGMKMAEEADKHGLDWRLLPAIAVRESTGGIHACIKVPNSFFGWGSCKIGFKSKEEAIEVVARNLGGNNPKTSQHYDNKTVKEILQKYNPPTIVPRYAEQVMKIMSDMGAEDMSTTLDTAVSFYGPSVQRG